MWLKADLHLHTCEGPESIVRWTPRELIDLAAQAGYQVLSITDHDTRTYTSSLARYAQDRGIALIPGVEATVEGRHVLLYNFPHSPDVLRTFDDIRRRKGPNSLVIAPHPFFPGPTSLRWRLLEHLDLFDAVEYSHYYTTWIDYNRQMLPMARGYDLPLVGGSDAHLPCQLGTTYSLVEADPDPTAVLAAIRAGRVRIVSRPLTSRALCAIGLALMGGSMLRPGSWLVHALQSVLGVAAVGTSASVPSSPVRTGFGALVGAEGPPERRGFALPGEHSASSHSD